MSLNDCLFNIYYTLSSHKVIGSVVGIGATWQIRKYRLGGDKCYEEKISKYGD